MAVHVKYNYSQPAPVKPVNSVEKVQPVSPSVKVSRSYLWLVLMVLLLFIGVFAWLKIQKTK